MTTISYVSLGNIIELTNEDLLNIVKSHGSIGMRVSEYDTIKLKVSEDTIRVKVEIAE